MGLWIHHPRTGEDDTMLTFAVGGLLISVAIVATYITLGRLLADATGVVSSVLGFTLGAYTARKFTDAKYTNGNGNGNGNGKITPTGEGK